MWGFISYSHVDYPMHSAFMTHLASIERAFDVRFWADTRLQAGFHWRSEIEEAISRSDLFLLLTSPGFIASDYIYEYELPAIRSRRRTAAALVIPVVLKRCFWSIVADVLQAVPTERGQLRPISDWGRQENGFDRAREQIGSAIATYFGIQPKTAEW